MKLKIKNGSVYHNKRVDNTNDSTLGILKLDDVNIGFVIEDEHRDKKVRGETRIKAGIYDLKILKLDTPLTLKYRAKYPWFKYHIELNNVPQFIGVYVHIGNFESSTDGCQIIGTDAAITANGEFRNKYSTVMFKKWYLATYKALEEGKEVFWKITDN